MRSLRPPRPLPAAALALLAALLAAPAAADDEALRRERAEFQQGMDLFKQGQYGGAAAIWEPIVARLGDERGFRLLYNLGVAYQEAGLATPAADRFERFLAEASKQPGERLPPEVAQFQTDARARLADLQARNARLRFVVEGGGVVTVRVDAFDPTASSVVAYVRPGPHRVTLRVGDAAQQSRDLVAERGVVTDIRVPLPSPPAAPSASPAPSASAAAPPAPPPVMTVFLPPPPGPPFSPVLLGVAAGAAVASLALPLLLRSSALDIKNAYDQSSPVPAQDAQIKAARRDQSGRYASATTRYEASWALPSALALGTGVLAAYYLFGPRREAQAPRVGLGIGPGALFAGISGELPGR